MSDLSDLRAKVDKLSELAVRTDENVQWIRDARDYQLKRTEEHERRLSRVERWQYWIGGIAAAVGAWVGVGGAGGLKH